MWRLIRQSGQADTSSRSAAPATEDATYSSVTPTPERASEGDFRDNVRTRPPSGRFVVLSSSSADTDISTSPQVVPLVSSAQAGVNVPMTEPASDGHTSSVLELEVGAFWNITNNARIDNPVTCRNLLDHVTPLGYWAALRNQHDAGFLDSFNINSAQHVCMVSELRLRYEHDIVTREKYEKKFTNSVAVAPGVVKPEIGGNMNFEIKSQFMRELREDTFSGNKNDDAHEHVKRVLDIVSLFNILGVSHDAVMLCIFLEVMVELLLNKCMEKAQTESNLSITNTNNDMNIELNKDFLTKLQNNAYHGIHHEDVVDHIAMVLEMLDLINIPGVDSHQLRMNIFPLSLADDARQWWINEGEGKITTWEELVENFFCKFYLESYDGEEEMLDEGNNWRIDPIEFISRVNSSFKNRMRVDGRTKK
ncbi:hypothetical protein Tco_1025667, partial [Tanacetum coccineum]